MSEPTTARSRCVMDGRRNGAQEIVIPLHLHNSTMHERGAIHLC